MPSLRAFAERVDCVLVVTQPDRPSGRGLRLQPTPVKAAAIELGLPTIEPERLRDALATLAERDADVFALASYGKLVPQAILDVPSLGALNVHPSLLPRYRGAAPLQGQLRDGVTDGGVTIIAMDAGLDTGDIVAVRRSAIGPCETYGALHDRFAALGATLLGRACDSLRDGTLTRTPQAGLAPETEIAATMTRAIGKEAWLLGASARDATMQGFVDQIRSLAPAPGVRLATTASSSTGVAKVIEARVFGSGPPVDVPVGDTVAVDGWLLARATDGWIVFERVVPAGRREMTAGEYRRGNPITEPHHVEATLRDWFAENAARFGPHVDAR